MHRLLVVYRGISALLTAVVITVPFVSGVEAQFRVPESVRKEDVSGRFCSTLFEFGLPSQTSVKRHGGTETLSTDARYSSNICSRHSSSVLPSNPAAIRRDSTRYGWEEIKSSWKWIGDHFGGDVFVDGEIWMPPSSSEPLIGAVGVGAEMRLIPIFLGGVLGFGVGLGGEDVLSSLYIGSILHGTKLQFGTSCINNGLTSSEGYSSSYRGYFVAVARRFGKVAFVEPSVKVVLPATGELRNLFVVAGLQLGVGFN